MRRRGFSLLELTLVTALAGLLLALALPRLGRARDGAAVRAAMSELGAAFFTARQDAILRRVAVAVVLDTVDRTVELRARGSVILQRGLGSSYGVELATTRDSAMYDARGLGYGISNLTVTVRRGAIVDTLTMSRLGRVRW